MEQKHLKKEINLVGALSTVMGTVIGAGVFFKVASVVNHTQNASATLFAWALAGILTICGGLTVAELATAIPKTGGAVRYIEEAYGKLPSFLLGWAQMIVYFPANIAALSIIFATQCINLFHLSPSVLLPLAILVGSSVTGINLLGTKVAANVQSVTLIVKLLPISLIILAGLFTQGQVQVALVDASFFGQTNAAHNFAAALLATLFAYDGWLNVGNVAGEMKHPQKDLPKAIILGLSFVTLVYVLINWAFLKNLPVAQVAGNLNAANLAAVQMFGNFGGKLVTIGILISVYGALNGYTMTGIRVPYALAKEDELPLSRYFKRLSKHTAIPYVAALFQLAIAIVMMCLGNFDLLTDMLVFVMWFFSILIFAAVFVLRKTQPDLPRPYKVPFYPVLPLIAIFGGGFILVMTIVYSTQLALTGIGLTLLGVPVFYLGRKIK